MQDLLHSPDTHADASVRQRLFSAATHLFATKGYAATSVNEIVQAAGVTKPILHHYFKNKEGIFLEILREAQRDMEVMIEEECQRTSSSAECLIHLALSVFSQFQQKIDTVRMFFSVYYGPSEGLPAKDLDQIRMEDVQTVYSLASAGLSSGEFRGATAQEITLGVLGMSKIVMDESLGGRPVESAPQMLERLLRLFLESITAKQSPESVTEEKCDEV